MVNGVKTLTGYAMHMQAFDTQNVDNYTGIVFAPSLVRDGHEAQNGYCQICNYKSTDVDGDPLSWQGSMHINHWHSISLEAAQEIVIAAHGANQPGETATTPQHRGFTVEANRINFDPVLSFESTMAMSVTSDERQKNIIDELEPSIEDIAGVRVVDFSYKKDKFNTPRAGSIAQDWQEVIPNAVTENQEGILSLDYGAVATVSAVTAAKEIVKLK
jgi:hypothetical protein